MKQEPSDFDRSRPSRRMRTRELRVFGPFPLVSRFGENSSGYSEIYPACNQVGMLN
jgi:hypothetical protein